MLTKVMRNAVGTWVVALVIGALLLFVIGCTVLGQTGGVNVSSTHGLGHSTAGDMVVRLPLLAQGNCVSVGGALASGAKQNPAGIGAALAEGAQIDPVAIGCALVVAVS